MALLYTLLCLVLFQILPIFAINKGICRPPSQVLKELQNRYDVKLYDTNISIAYDLDNIYAKTLTNNVMELSLRTASVSFVGYAMPKDKSTVDITKINFNTKPIFIHHMQQGSKINCKAESSENFNISLSLEAKEVEAAIIELVEYCIESYVCENYDSLVTHDFLQKQILEQQELNSKNPRLVIHSLSNKRAERNSNAIYNDSCNERISNIYNLQSAINAMVDFGVQVLISKIDIRKNGVFKIPKIYSEFQTGESSLRSTGEFTAAKGTFENIRNVKRIKDMIFTNENRRFSVASTYRLAPAKLKYASYKVKYGTINTNGELLVDIDSITVSAKGTFDYNKKPCVASLSYLDIDELGEIKISMTGLGIMDDQASNIISSQIRSKALESIKAAIVKKLNELNCEKFRPI